MRDDDPEPQAPVMLPAPLRPAPDPAPQAILDTVWLSMIARYGGRWERDFGSLPKGVTADVWAHDLAGLTIDEVKRGLNALRSRSGEWPPGAPEFRALCLAIPSLAEVRAELTRPNAERTGFGRLVWRLLDGWAFRGSTARDADRMLREAYDEARRRVLDGEPVPPAPGILGKPADPAPARPAAPEVVELHVERARRALGDPEVEQDPEVGELGEGEPA